MCKRHTGDFDGSQDDFEDGGVIEGKIPIVEIFSKVLGRLITTQTNIVGFKCIFSS